MNWYKFSLKDSLTFTVNYNAILGCHSFLLIKTQQINHIKLIRIWKKIIIILIKKKKNKEKKKYIQWLGPLKSISKVQFKSSHLLDAICYCPNRHMIFPLSRGACKSMGSVIPFHVAKFVIIAMNPIHIWEVPGLSFSLVYFVDTSAHILVHSIWLYQLEKSLIVN